MAWLVIAHFDVMAGLDPAIHVSLEYATKDVDARDKPGHDELGMTKPT
jgi:hypothetical protein